MSPVFTVTEKSEIGIKARAHIGNMISGAKLLKRKCPRILSQKYGHLILDSVFECRPEHSVDLPRSLLSSVSSAQRLRLCTAPQAPAVRGLPAAGGGGGLPTHRGVEETAGVAAGPG